MATSDSSPSRGRIVLAFRPSSKETGLARGRLHESKREKDAKGGDLCLRRGDCLFRRSACGSRCFFSSSLDSPNDGECHNAIECDDDNSAGTNSPKGAGECSNGDRPEHCCAQDHLSHQRSLEQWSAKQWHSESRKFRSGRHSEHVAFSRSTRKHWRHDGTAKGVSRVLGFTVGDQNTGCKRICEIQWRPRWNGPTTPSNAERPWYKQRRMVERHDSIL